MSEAEVIARLYREINALKEERDAVLFTYNQADKELAELRKLAARAADRIYMWVDAGLDPSVETKELIAELRKAAG
jgi:hypothetical protein